MCYTNTTSYSSSPSDSTYFRPQQTRPCTLDLINPISNSFYSSSSSSSSSPSFTNRPNSNSRGTIPAPKIYTCLPTIIPPPDHGNLPPLNKLCSELRRFKVEESVFGDEIRLIRMTENQRNRSNGPSIQGYLSYLSDIYPDKNFNRLMTRCKNSSVLSLSVVEESVMENTNGNNIVTATGGVRNQGSVYSSESESDEHDERAGVPPPPPSTPSFQSAIFGTDVTVGDPYHQSVIDSTQGLELETSDSGDGMVEESDDEMDERLKKRQGLRASQKFILKSCLKPTKISTIIDERRGSRVEEDGDEDDDGGDDTDEDYDDESGGGFSEDLSGSSSTEASSIESMTSSTVNSKGSVLSDFDAKDQEDKKIVRFGVDDLIGCTWSKEDYDRTGVINQRLNFREILELKQIKLELNRR